LIKYNLWLIFSSRHISIVQNYNQENSKQLHQAVICKSII
jgi:hypothetical protein